MAVTLKVDKVWPVDKYARLVTDKATQKKQLLPASVGEADTKKTGDWQHFTAKDGASLQLALLESNHFMISCGSHIYESFSLWETRRWIKGVTKGDSILFLYRVNDENRRFRIKFAPSSSTSTSLETCQSCITALSPLISIRDVGLRGAGTSTDPTACDADYTQGFSQYYPSSQSATQLQSQLPSSVLCSTQLGSSQLATTPSVLCSTQLDYAGPQSLLTVGLSEMEEPSSLPKIDKTSLRCDDPLSVRGSGSSNMADAAVCPDVIMRNSSSDTVAGREGVVVIGVQQKESQNGTDMIQVAQIAKAIHKDGSAKTLGNAYAETNFPTEQLSSFIRLCLTDANFPSFVEAVEQELNGITGAK